MTHARFHVIPYDGHWLVVGIGELFRGPYRTKDEAVGAAELTARLRGPSQVLVYDLAGRLEREAHYG